MLYFRPHTGWIRETDQVLSINGIRNYREDYRVPRKKKQKIEIKTLGELKKYSSLPKPVRAGLVVYRIDPENGLEICIGIDENYRQYTNFAGAVEYPGENCIDGAYREFNEETYEIFIADSANERRDENLLCYDDSNLMIFAETVLPKSVINGLFSIRRQKIVRQIIEIHEFAWFKIDDLIELLQDKSPLVWEKIRNILLIGCIKLREMFRNETETSGVPITEISTMDTPITESGFLSEIEVPTMESGFRSDVFDS